MKALIIEDETAAATNLKSLLREIDPSVEIVDVIDTVVDPIGWIRANPLPDIVHGYPPGRRTGFQDFRTSRYPLPGSFFFTTAYDRYALDAFKVNSIDYILADQKRGTRTGFRKIQTAVGPRKSRIRRTDPALSLGAGAEFSDSVSRQTGSADPGRDRLIATPPTRRSRSVTFPTAGACRWTNRWTR